MAYDEPVDESFIENVIASEHQEILWAVDRCKTIPFHARELAVRRFFRALSRHREMENALLYENLRLLEYGEAIALGAELNEFILNDSLTPHPNLDVDQECWENYFEKARELLENHFEHEERKVLPHAKLLFEQNEWKRMGLLYAFIDKECPLSNASPTESNVGN